MEEIKDIEIVLMDKNFVRFETIKDFSSLQWFERYYGVGTFELHLDRKYIPQLRRAAYVYWAFSLIISCSKIGYSFAGPRMCIGRASKVRVL